MRLSLRLAAVALLVTFSLAAVPAVSAETATGSGKSSPPVGAVAVGFGDRLAALWDTMIRIVFGSGGEKPGDDGDQMPGSEIDPNGRGVRGR